MLRRRIALLAIVPLAVATWVSPEARAVCPSSAACVCPRSSELERHSRTGRWFVAETDNFQICCDHSAERAGQLARHAEALRDQLCARWLSGAEGHWNPKCQIVLHSDRPSYIAAVGRGGERTLGSSLVDSNQGQIVARRIDLLGTGEFLSAALPHELTHVVLPERLRGQVPRWADEGAALLADLPAKRAAHRRDLRAALSRQAAFDLAALVSLQEYPPGDRWGAFYGQSLSLVELLVERGGCEQFVKFLSRAADEGYDRALLACYEINGVAALERLWRRELVTSDAALAIAERRP